MKDHWKYCLVVSWSDLWREISFWNLLAVGDDELRKVWRAYTNWQWRFHRRRAGIRLVTLISAWQRTVPHVTAHPNKASTPKDSDNRLTAVLTRSKSNRTCLGIDEEACPRQLLEEIVWKPYDQSFWTQTAHPGSLGLSSRWGHRRVVWLLEGSLWCRHTYKWGPNQVLEISYS